jgi:hypothetical protein
VRKNYSVQREPVWPPGKIRNRPKFHGLVWKFGQSQQEAVYCRPYFEAPECLRLARPCNVGRNAVARDDVTDKAG